jgi:hypothetical protein
VQLEPERHHHGDDDHGLPGQRHHLLERPADQQCRPRQRRDEHPLVGAGLELEEQVGAGGRRPEQRRHAEDRRHEPLPHGSPVGGAAHRAGQQRPEQAEEHQRLDHAEQQRERVPDHRAELAHHDDADVADEVAAAGVRERRRVGDRERAHAATCSFVSSFEAFVRAVVPSSRRLRPVSERKTSSSVGRCT